MINEAVCPDAANDIECREDVSGHISATVCHHLGPSIDSVGCPRRKEGPQCDLGNHSLTLPWVSVNLTWAALV